MNLSSLIIPSSYCSPDAMPSLNMTCLKYLLRKRRQTRRESNSTKGPDNLQDGDAPLGEGVEDIANNVRRLMNKPHNLQRKTL